MLYNMFCYIACHIPRNILCQWHSMLLCQCANGTVCYVSMAFLHFSWHRLMLVLEGQLKSELDNTEKQFPLSKTSEIKKQREAGRAQLLNP